MATRAEKVMEARVALTALLDHVYLSCAEPGWQPCEWCAVVVAFDHAVVSAVRSEHEEGSDG